jgi:hypothetical protein
MRDLMTRYPIYLIFKGFLKNPFLTNILLILVKQMSFSNKGLNEKVVLKLVNRLNVNSNLW